MDHFGRFRHKTRLSTATLIERQLHMRTRVPLARRFIAALLIGLLTGCHTWQPTTASPHVVIQEENPSSIRFTTPSGEIVTIPKPLMRNDSIVSTETGIDPVASSDVSGLEVQQFSIRQTIGFMAGIALVAMSWTRLVTGSSGGAEPGEGPLDKPDGS